MSKLSLPILRLQNSTTTNAISTHLSQNPHFLKLSQHELKLTQQRDDEDGQKLIQGIELAISKNVLPRLPATPHYEPVYVDGKTPCDVAKEIIGKCRGVGDEGSGGGGVIVLCGLSGTGKGTTVSQLKSDLSGSGERGVVCWSNGNIFRSVTLLSTTWCEMEGKPLEEALSPGQLSSFMDMLSFVRIDGKWDTIISGLGFDNERVSLIQNTLLKSPQVSKNIPTVAKETQGEVVKFAADAIGKMTAEEEGLVVLLEGRSPTVDYVVTDNRFELRLKDESVIGTRRAAQRLMGGVAKKVGDGAEDVEALLMEELEMMVNEIGED